LDFFYGFAAENTYKTITLACWFRSNAILPATQTPELMEETVSYLQLEVAASVAGSLANFFLLIILVNQWTAFALAALAIQVIQDDQINARKNRPKCR
jgi:hypothetical protein